MHNQHISGIVQDVPTTSGIEKLFFNPPELHRINTQRNQRCCDLSRRSIGVWKYQGAVRQENACSQESTEKNVTFKKNLIQNQSIALAFWDTPFQRRE